MFIDIYNEADIAQSIPAEYGKCAVMLLESCSG